MRTSRRHGALVLAASALLVLSGCGDDTVDEAVSAATSAAASAGNAASEAAASAAATPSRTTARATTATPTRVEVTEDEFSIQLSEDTYAPGDYVFAFTNAAQFPHNLVIEGPGLDSKASATVAGGKSGELRVTLREGTYDVWCGVGNHREQGMETEITVRA